MKKLVFFVVAVLSLLGLAACKVQTVDASGNCVNYNIPNVATQPTAPTRYVIKAAPCKKTAPTTTVAPTPTTTTEQETTTAPPITTTNPPTTTSSVPANSDFPTQDNTGATGPFNADSGEVILGDPGQVYENMRVDGSITVTACNVTIRNVEVDAGGDLAKTDEDVFAIWLKQDETCPVTLDHVSVITKPAPNNYVTTGVRDAFGAPINMSNSKLVGVQIGVLGFGAGTLQDNYIELGKTLNGVHNEDIEVSGSNGITFNHNTFLNQNDQTAALALFTEFGQNKNMLIENNLLAGGGYTCYCGDGATDNAGNPAPADNVSFINNVFWRKYFPTVGAFAPGRAYRASNGGQWTGNVFMEQDGTLTTNLVPQPPVDN